MSAKRKIYHVNPDTGRANLCDADPIENCKFGNAAIHSNDKKEAQKLYEQHMEDKTYDSTLSKPVKSSPDTSHIVMTKARPQYTILASQISLAEQKLEKANKRLAKHGFEERFELEVVEEHAGKFERNGVTLYKPTVTVELNRPRIAPAGYSFEAAATTTPDGKLVFTPSESGKLTKENVPTEQRCDHCGQNRRRDQTYLIRNPEGKIEQVGSSCVDAYMGVKVQGLWALEYDPLKEDDGTLHDEEDEDFYGGTHFAQMPRDSQEMMAYVLAVSDGGKRFVSRHDETYFNKRSTASNVELALWRDDVGEDDSWAKEVQQKVEQYQQNGEATAMLKKVNAFSQKQSGEYWSNVQTVTSSEMLNPRHMGIFVSSLNSMQKAEEKERAAKAEADAYVPGFAGEPKDKMKDRQGKIKKVHHYTQDNYRTGQPEDKTVITFTDEEGHEMVWFSSREIDHAQAGDSIQFTGGSVKKHDSYRGRDQTILTRVKFEVDAASEA